MTPIEQARAMITRLGNESNWHKSMGRSGAACLARDAAACIQSLITAVEQAEREALERAERVCNQEADDLPPGFERDACWTCAAKVRALITGKDK